jgi:hypothetical protein
MLNCSKKNRFVFLGDWKQLCTCTTFLERIKITDNAGLVDLLNRLAGIKPENVSSRKNKQQKEETPIEESYLGNLSDYLLYYFGSFNLESNSGKSQHLHGTLEHMSIVAKKKIKIDLFCYVLF